MFWNTSVGTPASAKALTSRSPASRVCVACFSMTAFPAISAGATVLMLVFLWTRATFERWEAALFLAAYAAYITLQAIGVENFI